MRKLFLILVASIILLSTAGSAVEPNQMASTSWTIQDKYSVNLNEVPGHDTGKFIKFLNTNYNATWVKKENITKSNDRNIIYAVVGTNSFALFLNGDSAKLEINGSEVDTFNVISKKNKTYLAKERFVDLFVSRSEGITMVEVFVCKGTRYIWAFCKEGVSYFNSSEHRPVFTMDSEMNHATLRPVKVTITDMLDHVSNPENITLKADWKGYGNITKGMDNGSLVYRDANATGKLNHKKLGKSRGTLEATAIQEIQVQQVNAFYEAAEYSVAAHNHKY